MSAQQPDLRTRAEITNYEETSTYADLERIGKGLVSSAAGLVHAESFGTTEEGRSLPLLVQLVILIAPDYNADGNEKVNMQNRTAQYGPVAGVGTRENAKGLDLNRDYMKLDSLEARSLVGLMNKWDPHVLVDLHMTNGSCHAFHLTYSPILNPNADARLIEFTA